MDEVRIPVKLLQTALARKQTKLVRLLAAAKLEGHKSEINALFGRLKVQPKTGQRLIKKILAQGWAGTDGTYLFPRAWRKLSLSKRGGLYLTQAPLDLKKFEALAFAMALKKILSGKASPTRSDRGRTKQSPDLPTTYLTQAIGIKERRFKSLKAAAQRYRYIAVTPQARIIGPAKDYPTFKKNIHGPPIFIRGKHTVCPEISKIRVLI